MVAFDPEESHRDRPEGAVALLGLVVAGGEGAELGAAVDAALDAGAQPVGRAVERAGPAVAGPPRGGVAAPAPAAGAAGATAPAAPTPRPPGRAARCAYRTLPTLR